MRWLLSPLLLMSGLICLQVAFTTSQPTSAQQHHTRIVSQHIVKAKTTTHRKAPVFVMPPVSTAVAVVMPNAPSAASLGLTSDKQQWITLAYQDAIDAESNKADTLFPMIFVKQIKQESGFQINDASGQSITSSAGAVGISQFLPSTAASLGIDPYVPQQALKGAAMLMVSYVHKYHSYALALAAYNAGSGTVNTCIATSDWYGCLPGETQNYITVILG